MNFFSLFDCCRKETPDEQSERKRIPELYYDHAFIHKPVIRTWLYGLHMALHKDNLTASQPSSPVYEKQCAVFFCCNLRHPHIFPGIDSHSAFDVVVVLTRTLETFCSDAESYAAVFRRVNFLLPVGGLLILVGVLGRTASNVTMPPVTKETLETALLTSGFGNMYWILKDLDTRPCSRGVYSYVFVSNKIWEGHPV